MYVAIVETAKDSLRKDFKGLPPEYPTVCAEFDSREAAELAHPGAKILSGEEYQIYHEAMQTIKNHVESKQPWWKFWGKK